MRLARLIWLVVTLMALIAVACSGGDTKLKCTGHDDCFENNLCDTDDTHVCLRQCTDDDNLKCLSGQSCRALSDDSGYVCRDGQPGGDPNVGDPGSGDPGSGDSSGD